MNLTAKGVIYLLQKSFRLREKLIACLTLVFLLTFSSAAFAAIPVGTVIFGNGQALDLAYANNQAHTAEVTQDVISSNGVIYIKMFNGQILNNATGKAVTDLSVLPAVTYKDANGNITKYEAGDGPQVADSDKVVATVSPAAFGSLVTVSIQNPVNLVKATKYQVFSADGLSAVSSIESLGNATTIYPAAQVGDTLKVQLYDSASTAIGAMQAVVLQTGGTTATITSVAPVNVTTPAGIAPDLPATVTAKMSDGTTKIVDVTWEAIDASKYASAGTFTVSGTIAESATIKAAATVTVNATDFVVATVSPSSSGFGSLVTVSITNPFHLANATQFQVCDTDGNAISQMSNLGQAATVFPAKAIGDNVLIKFFEADGKTLVGSQTVSLQS